jgi:YbgC/YbaW family acyl-CoA thioester hydrolase
MTTPFRYYLRVRYQECDPQHVVFNARYGDYADLACFEFMRAALPRPQDAFDGTFEMQTVRQVVEWKAPARFDDVIEVSIRASRLGTTSFTLSCELRRAGEAERAGDDRDSLRPRRCPDLEEARDCSPDACRPRSGRRRQDHRPRRVFALSVPSPREERGEGDPRAPT